MCSVPAEYRRDTVRIFIIVYTAFTSIVHASLINNNTTYFQTRQLSGQQYGLDYNLQNYVNSGRNSSSPRTLFDWSSPNGVQEQTQIQNTKKIDQNLETDERVVNNVWWPWKNYDDWLNGRGLKAEQPKKKGKKHRKEKKDRKKNRKNERKRKKQKTDKKKSKVAIGSENRSPVFNTKEDNEFTEKNNRLSTNTTFENNKIEKKNNRLSINVANEDNEIIKKESIPEIQYRESPIDIILRNLSLVPTLVKYSSRNYTYDVNECLTNNGGCEGLCINTPGSYRCHCPPGFMVADTKCEDIDECLLRNGHGPCQGSCANTWGGYKCSCHGIPGTKLSGDGHTCDDVDECRDGTAGCSHQCINTTGSAFCVCPDGLQLDADWKTCVDVDECSDAELQQCENGATCLNTYGSYSCA